MTGPRIHWISPDDPPEAFPQVADALAEPNGLLAAGGDLSEARLLAAYTQGIFPWYEEGQPVLWWSPEPRCILRPGAYRLSRRARRSLRQADLSVSFNRRFVDVVEHCAAQRDGRAGTWITTSMLDAYSRLHASGWAHSVEILAGGSLVGGLYGVGIGRIFFGESMFSREDNASKAALLALCHHLALEGFPLLDCQVESGHLIRLGAEVMKRDAFRAVLKDACTPVRSMSIFPQEERRIVDYING